MLTDHRIKCYDIRVKNYVVRLEHVRFYLSTRSLITPSAVLAQGHPGKYPTEDVATWLADADLSATPSSSSDWRDRLKRIRVLVRARFRVFREQRLGASISA